MKLSALIPLVSELKRHPVGLRILFATELFERFSFYGMRALLILYLVNELKLPREQASSIYAIYTSLVYLTPLIGGQIADVLLGRRIAVLIGGLVMALGHFALAFPGLLYEGLGLLIVGNGFFKPNISSQVGDLYPNGDARHDRGYLLFYASINIGAMFSPLVCGSLGQRLGWHYGFGAAGFGMLIALGVFACGQKLIGSGGWAPQEPQIERAGFVARDWGQALIWTLGLLGVVELSLLLAPLYSPDLAPVGLFFYRLVLVALLSVAIGKILRRFQKQDSGAALKLSSDDRNCILTIAVMTLFLVFFCMAFEQAGNSMALFADQKTRCELFGYEFPSSWFQALNPLFVIFFTWITGQFGRRLPCSVYAKQGWGLIVLSLGCILMQQAEAMAITEAGQVSRVSPFWLIGVFLIFTLAELMISPVGLSLVKKLSPPTLVSSMMGVIFVGVYAGNYLAGTLEQIIHSLAGASYGMWNCLTLICGLGGGLFLLISPLLVRLSVGRER